MDAAGYPLPLSNERRVGVTGGQSSVGVIADLG
jgi:hypothetical protein